MVSLPAWTEKKSPDLDQNCGPTPRSGPFVRCEKFLGRHGILARRRPGPSNTPKTWDYHSCPETWDQKGKPKARNAGFEQRLREWFTQIRARQRKGLHIDVLLGWKQMDIPGVREKTPGKPGIAIYFSSRTTKKDTPMWIIATPTQMAGEFVVWGRKLLTQSRATTLQAHAYRADVETNG